MVPHLADVHGLDWDQLEAVEVADAAAEDQVAGGEDVGVAEVVQPHLRARRPPT